MHGEGGYELLADTGTLSAMEYSLRGQPEKPMAAGSVTPMAVIPEMPGAQVSGTEVFTAVLTAPGGTSEHLDVHVLDDRSGFRLKAAWMLAGQYSVRVLLDGVDIVGSPSLVEVVPGGLCLATSLMQGSALRVRSQWGCIRDGHVYIVNMHMVNMHNYCCCCCCSG